MLRDLTSDFTKHDELRINEMETHRVKFYHKDLHECHRSPLQFMVTMG